MSNDSTALGFLRPIGDTIPVDDALRDLVYTTLVGLTGLEGDMVRPAFQKDPPAQPDFDADWLAFRITAGPTDTFAFEGHDGSGDGSSYVQRNQVLEVAVFVYGPNAEHYDAWIRDGLQITQNRDILRSFGIAVISHDAPTTLPALTKQQFVWRVDSTIVLRRSTVRTFGVRNVLSAQGEVHSEKFSDKFDTNASH